MTADAIRRFVEGRVPTLQQVTTAGNTTINSINSDSGYSYSKTFSYGWEITQREALKATPLPVPSFRPTTTNTAIALDIMPNGSPSDFSTNGKAWVDVCDTDAKVGQPPIGA